MTSPGLGAYSTERTRRARQMGPLNDRLTARGRRWGDARAWALAEIDASRRPTWRRADAPVQTPNAVILAAYLDHLDTEGTTTP